MNIDNFEKKAKALFNQYRPEADNEQIWLQIEPKLKKKKRRRLLLLFFWAIGLSLLLGGLFWGKSHWDTTAMKSGPEALPATQPSPAPAQTLNAAQNTTNQQPDPSAETPALANEMRVGPSAQNGLKKTQPKAVENKQATAARPATMVLSGLPTVADQAPASYPAVRQPSNEMPAEKAPATLPVPVVGAVGQDEKPLAGTLPPLEAQAVPDSSKLFPIKNKEGAAHSVPKTPAKPKPAAHKKNRKKKSTLQHSIALQTGLAMPFKQLQIKQATAESEALLDNRKSSEKSLEAFSVGLQYTLATPKGLIFKTGLDYRRFNEKFEMAYTEQKVEVIQGVISITVDGSGSVIGQTMGSKTVTTTKEYSNTAFNSFQFYNLPLGLGYQKAHKKQSWEISAGLDVNIAARFRGTQFNASGYPTAYVYPGSNSLYRKHIGLGIWGAYGYARQLNRRLKWQASVLASAPFNPVTVNDYPLVQRYFSIGLQAGLVLNLTPEKRKHKGHTR